MLNLRADSDPDYAFWSEEEFASRLQELSGLQTKALDVRLADFSSFGAINTHSNSAERVDLSGSIRKHAWRNVMVAGINAGIEQRLFSIRPSDCRWPGWSVENGYHTGTYFEFSITGIPALGWVTDIGYDELSIHVALWPTEWSRETIKAANAGFHAGEVFATGWMERRKGAWLQVSNDAGGGWTFNSRKAKLVQIAELKIRPHGYATQGSFMM